MKIREHQKRNTLLVFLAYWGVAVCFPISALAKEEGSNVTVHTSSQTAAVVPANYRDTLQETFDEMNQMVQRMNEWIQRNWPEAYGRKDQHVFRPDMDMSETAAEYVIKMDLPGMRKEDIQIEIVDQTVTISGERKMEAETTTKEGVHRRERHFGAFQRSVTLPDPIKMDQVAADYQNGILTVRIPKLVSSGGQKKVKVRIS